MFEEKYCLYPQKYTLKFTKLPFLDFHVSSHPVSSTPASQAFACFASIYTIFALNLLASQLLEIMLDVVVRRSLATSLLLSSARVLLSAESAHACAKPARPPRHHLPYRVTSDIKPQFARNLSSVQTSSSMASYKSVSRGSANTGDFRMFITAADGTPVSAFHDIPM